MPLDDDFGGGCVIFLIIVAVVIAIIASQNDGARKKALGAYREALHRLKADPTNPNLREETLRLGRTYSNLTRNRRGVTVFDEVALMNDINAACAAASAPRERVAPSQSVESRLSRLGELKSQGLIDDQEYAERRREILREI